MRIFHVCFRKVFMLVVKKDSYEVPAIFKLLAEKGDIAEQMMYNTFQHGSWYGDWLLILQMLIRQWKLLEEAGEKAYMRLVN